MISYKENEDLYASLTNTVSAYIYTGAVTKGFLFQNKSCSHIFKQNNNLKDQ